MGTFLVAIITCNQLIEIVNRLQEIIQLTPEQKIAIVGELKKVTPSCPLIIKKNENR